MSKKILQDLGFRQEKKMLLLIIINVYYVLKRLKSVEHFK